MTENSGGVEMIFAWSGAAGKVVASFIVAPIRRVPRKRNRIKKSFVKVERLLACGALEKLRRESSSSATELSGLEEELEALVGMELAVPDGDVHGMVMYIERPTGSHALE